MIYLTTADTLRRARLALGRITKAKAEPIADYSGRPSLALYKRKRERVARLHEGFERRFGPGMLAELDARERALKYARDPENRYVNLDGAKRLARWARTATYEASKK